MAIAGRMGALVVVAIGLSVAEAVAQDPAAAAGREPKFSIEGSAGFQLSYRGTAQTVAFGVSPNRNLTILISATRLTVRDKIQQFNDGLSAERGSTDLFVSGEVRYAFLAGRRVSPYVAGGMGRGISRPNISEFFPDVKERQIHLIQYGGGVRIPMTPRLDAYIDTRFIMAVEAATDYFAVRMPVRAGLAWRF